MATAGSYSTTAITTGKGKVGGIIFAAPLGTTLPTDSTTALDAAFVNVGYIADDAITNSFTIDSEQIREHDGQIVLVAQTDLTDTWQWSMMQNNDPNALSIVYGDSNVTTTGSVMTIKHNNATRVGRSYVVELNNKRVVVPDAFVSANDDITYERSSNPVIGVTVTALPDAEGNSGYEYYPVVVTPPSS